MGYSAVSGVVSSPVQRLATYLRQLQLDRAIQIEEKRHKLPLPPISPMPGMDSFSGSGGTAPISFSGSGGTAPMAAIEAAQAAQRALQDARLQSAERMQAAQLQYQREAPSIQAEAKDKNRRNAARLAIGVFNRLNPAGRQIDPAGLV